MLNCEINIKEINSASFQAPILPEKQLQRKKNK